MIDGSQIDASKWDFNDNGKIDAGDEFMSEYSEEQNALHREFLSTVGKETGRSVVFLFESAVSGSDIHDGAKLGDMPINRKWGYMFKVSGNPDARTLAHELGSRSVSPAFWECSEPKCVGRTNPDKRSAP